jgi:hypothetical protein
MDAAYSGFAYPPVFAANIFAIVDLADTFNADLIGRARDIGAGVRFARAICCAAFLAGAGIANWCTCARGIAVFAFRAFCLGTGICGAFSLIITDFSLLAQSRFSDTTGVYTFVLDANCDTRTITIAFA